MIKDIKVEIIKNKNLSENQKKTINNARLKNFGKAQLKDFSKDYEPDTLWFFIKRKNKVVSLVGIRPVKIIYEEKNYKIGGICSGISLEKKKGYGTIMVNSLINYSKKSGKTIIGFTGKTKFFSKAGLGTKKNFIRRFVWLKPNGEKVYDPYGDGAYYEGKDKLISKMLKNKKVAYCNIEYW